MLHLKNEMDDTALNTAVFARDLASPKLILATTANLVMHNRLGRAALHVAAWAFVTALANAPVDLSAEGQ